ncbi:MAG TPA: hypothetical protein VNN18_11890 [Candidatus Xenobia bacterium]|nr:hypothetical protein [Candidatus Xenobia bacterium]
MTRKLPSAIASLALLSLFAAPAFAQGFEIKTQRAVSTGAGMANFFWDTGEIITRDKARVKFLLHEDATGQVIGYKLAKADLEAVKMGDQIPLHFYGIDVQGDFFSGWHDAAGGKIFRDDFGGWRAVSLKSLESSGPRVTVKFEEQITLEDGRKIQQLDYEVAGEFLVPAPPPARYEAGSPERFLNRRDHTVRHNETLTSTWGTGEVISRDGVAVRFEVYEGAEGSLGGYKLASSDLGALKPGDQVLLHFRGLKVTGDWKSGFQDATGAKVFRGPGGGWRVATITAVRRATGKVAVVLKEAVELEDGSKVSRLECQVADGWCSLAPAAASPPPAK